MMPDAPDLFLSTDFTDGEKIDNTKLFSRILDRVNQLVEFATGLPAGRLDGANADDPVNIIGTDVFHHGSASVTFTLTATRRVRITAAATVILGSSDSHTLGTYVAGCAYSPGSSASDGTAVRVGTVLHFSISDGAGQKNAVTVEGTTVLDAGTYTAFIQVSKEASGNDDDTIGSNYVIAFDEGVA